MPHHTTLRANTHTHTHAHQFPRKSNLKKPGAYWPVASGPDLKYTRQMLTASRGEPENARIYTVALGDSLPLECEMHVDESSK